MGVERRGLSFLNYSEQRKRKSFMPPLRLQSKSEISVSSVRMINDSGAFVLNLRQQMAGSKIINVNITTSTK